MHRTQRYDFGKSISAPNALVQSAENKHEPEKDCPRDSNTKYERKQRFHALG